MTREAADIDVVLFDVGGVLVELRGVETMLDWLGRSINLEELWRRWLQSTAVRQFETGRIDAAAFAQGVIREFGLPVAAPQFLESFVGWPTGLFPGALEMLARIPRRYRRALFSNSNSLHWPRVRRMGLDAAIEHQFVSHVIGLIKPDAEAFEHVVAALGCAPQQVLFLDDNALNVEAAQRLGLQAVRVVGVEEARRALVGRGVLGDGE